jgi:hypothetical protein
MGQAHHDADALVLEAHERLEGEEALEETLRPVGLLNRLAWSTFAPASPSLPSLLY